MVFRPQVLVFHGVTCFVNKNVPVSVTGATLDSASSLLTIAITASSIGSNAVVRCSVGGLRTPAAAAAARDDFSLWTLDSSGRKVDAVFGIRFPPIFDRLASRISSNANPLRMTSANDPHHIRSTVLSSFLCIVCFFWSWIDQNNNASRFI